MNVYLFLRYTKNMVTRNISFKSMKNFCVMNRNQKPDFDLSTLFFFNLGQARNYCLVSKCPGNLVGIIE